MNERAANQLTQLVVFTVHEQRYALHLSGVESVVRAVEITSLPRAPEIVLGVINVQGRVVPVVNLRKRFRYPERPVEVGDRLIVARTPRRSVVLVVDDVSGVVERPEKEVIAAGRILPGLEYLEGVVKLETGMILIHDLDKFLSLAEEKKLDDVLNA